MGRKRDFEEIMRDRTPELEAAREALRQSEQLLAVEVEAAQRLQQIATQLITVRETAALYEQILDTVQSLVRADLASIQMFYAERGTHGELRLLGQRGFSAEAAKRWEWVSPSTRTTCGEALRTGRRIVVPDVRTCDFMAGSEDLEGYLATGIRAAQSSPMISRSAELLGMVTTYWREPHELSASELRSLDVLARLAADLIERSRLDEARRKNEQCLAIYDTLRDVIFHVAVEPEGQFRYISVNAAFLKITGLSREMVVSKTVKEVIPESSRNIVLSKYQQAIEEKTIVVWEQTCDYPAGRLTAEISVAPVFDDKGTCTHLVGSLHDITEQKRAEAALRESEWRFRKLADTAPVMIWLTGPDKSLTFVNKTWLDFRGRTMEQELQDGWAAGIHPDDLERARDVGGAAFDARRNFQLECRLQRADGEYRLMLCNGIPLFGQDDVFEGYIGSNIDITDSQSEERFRQLAANIDQVLWMRDIATNRLTYVSPAYEKVWGSSPAAVYENRVRLLETVYPEDRPHVAAAMAKNDHLPFELTYRIVRPDGTLRWIVDRVFMIRDLEGKPYRTVGIAEDVTAQRELEEQLRQASKMEAVGRLAGGVAHDFNNLLTIIGGYSRMLLEDRTVVPPVRNKLEQIHTAASQATILTRQLLAFSRRQVLRPTLVNLNHLLTGIQEMLRRLIGEHISIKTELDPAVSCITADQHQIEQVVMNLAANARDAMPNGGEFRIQTMMVRGTEVEGKRSTGSGDVVYVRLRISDTGCGMDEHTRERAFEPFFTTKELGKGTGLGLSTVYGIVHQNQGKIHVTSKPGQGTVFDLYFPMVQEREAKWGETQKSGPKTAAAGTILLAEDEPALRGLVKEILEQLGCTVLEAENGYDALGVIERHAGEIHLLLTDVIMPRMNGGELAARVEALRPGTRVLYMSGHADDVLAFHGISRPELDFIQKPFSPSELAVKVTEVLAGAESRGFRGQTEPDDAPAR